MQHCTPEQLGLAALREPLPDVDATHLSACATCQVEVASLRRGVDALAVPQFAAPSAGVAPPASVWDAIAAATGVTTAPRPQQIVDPPATGTEVTAPVAVAPPPGPEPSAPPAVDDVVTEGVVHQFRPRRSRLLLAAACTLA